MLKNWFLTAAAAAATTMLTITAHPAKAQSKVRQSLQSMLPSAEAPSELEVAPKGLWLSVFYADRNMRPLWVGKRSVNKRFDKYLAALEKARDFGLDPDDYGYTSLKRMGEAASRSDLAMLELNASRSFVNFALDVREGRISPRLDFTEEELADRDIKRSDLFATRRQN